MRKVLIAAIVILSLILAALLGVIWYQGTHIFVDGEAYAKYKDVLDLREEDVSESHYLAVQAQLPDCEIIWNVPFQNGHVSSDTEQLTIAALTEEDIRLLHNYFPKLVKIDAGACKDYAVLAQLRDAVPHCDVVYQVELGGISASPETTELTLEDGNFEFDTLMTNLGYLTKLQSIHFPKANLTVEQQAALEEAFPDLTVSFTVEILGKEYDAQTTALDLSSMASSEVDAVAPKLSMLPRMKDVQLMGPSSISHLMLSDVQKLKAAAPDATFHYAFDFYGVTVSTTDEEVILKKLNVSSMPDSGIAGELRAMLDVMDSCKRIVVEGMSPYDKIWQKINSAELAKIREEYRDKTKVVWRVYFGENGSSLTDAEVLRAVYGLTDDNSHDMVYCENVRYLDLGHNEFLDYMDFLSGMKELEVAILSGAPLKSLDPIAACKNLKFLEIANCLYLPDINALKECTQLEMLNISFTRFEDLSPISDLNLTHLTTVKNAFVSKNEPGEALQAFIDAHPDCWTVYEGEQPYGVGWRYSEDEKHLDWYAKMIKAFKYPNPYNNIGWYLGDDFE